MMTPRTPEWYAERAAKMRAAKAEKAKDPVAYVATHPKERRGSKPGVKKIKWSFDEIATVTAATAPFLIKQGIHYLPDKSDRTGSGFLLEAIKRGQEVLPAERRRFGATFTSRNRFPTRFWDKLKLALKHAPHQLVPSPAVTEAQTNGQHAPAPAPEAQTPPSASQAWSVTAITEGLGSTPTQHLVSELVSRLFRMLETKSAPMQLEEIQRTLEERRKYDELLTEEMAELRKQVEALTRFRPVPVASDGTSEHEQERSKLPRVAVLGMFKDQFDVVQHEASKLGIAAELRFYDKEQKPREVNADYAISGRWVNHSWLDQVKRGVPHSKIAFFRGGVGQAISQLLVWFPLEKTA